MKALNILIACFIMFVSCSNTHSKLEQQSIIGKWKSVRREFVNNGSNKNFEGKELLVANKWEFTKNKFINHFEKNDRDIVPRYSINGDLLSIGVTKYVIEKLNTDSLVLVDYDQFTKKASRTGFREFFIKTNSFWED